MFNRIADNPNRLDKDRQPGLSGSGYLGTKSTHFDGELEGIALALEKHTEKGTGMVALLPDCKPGNTGSAEHRLRNRKPTLGDRGQNTTVRRAK